MKVTIAYCKISIKTEVPMSENFPPGFWTIVSAAKLNPMKLA